jgi:hypothetical protein
MFTETESEEMFESLNEPQFGDASEFISVREWLPQTDVVSEIES